MWGAMGHCRVFQVPHQWTHTDWARTPLALMLQDSEFTVAGEGCHGGPACRAMLLDDVRSPHFCAPLVQNGQ